MPTYEYACETCKNNFEVVQKMADAAIEVCPSCGKKVRRVLSGGIGISFKGSGFYVTDSASPGKAATGKTSATSAPAPVKPATTGTDK